MFTQRLIITLVFITMVLAGCREIEDDFVSPYTYNSYYPLSLGNVWVYQHSPGVEEKIVQINNIELSGRKEIHNFSGEGFFFFNVSGNKTKLYNDRGSLWGTSNGKECMILSSQPTIGEKHNLADLGEGSVEVLSVSERYHNYTCIKVKYSSGEDYWYLWLSRGFGIVKVYCSFDNSTYEIKSYSIAPN